MDGCAQALPPIGDRAKRQEGGVAVEGAQRAVFEDGAHLQVGWKGDVDGWSGV